MLCSEGMRERESEKKKSRCYNLFSSSNNNNKKYEKNFQLRWSHDVTSLPGINIKSIKGDII